MAHCWIEQEDEWAALPLEREKAYLLFSDSESVREWCEEPPPHDSVSLCPSGVDDGWLVLCPPGRCRVNGEIVAPGLRALADRDEVMLCGGSRLYFSTEQLARVVPFGGAAGAVHCPRCRQAIAPGADSVACPFCATTYHQDESSALPCWTYSPACAVCGHATALDAGFRWTPDAL